jgi:hypothetical protein
MAPQGAEVSPGTIDVVIVSPDGAVTDETIGNDLPSFHRAVGGYIEAVPLPDALGRVVGYVNEDGVRLQLAPNLIATLLCGTPIVGPLVIVGRAGVNETDVPPGLGAAIRAEL